MTRAEQLTALADRVEDLLRPCRETDALLRAHFKDGDPAYGVSYTASLDAALSLVPEGFFWSISKDGVRGGFTACCLCDGNMEWQWGVTPAMALTNAALRAMIAAQTGVGQA